MKQSTGKSLLKLLTALALYFGVLSPLPASASAVENCVDDQCTITFSFSSQMQIFTPPSNARNMTFDAFGAQGGRSGGSGGRVAGSFVAIPEVLYLFVGGVGAAAPNAAGGFNGGGAAGSGIDLPGSGGGATDIRTSLELDSRVVVAGGGGGRGAGLGSGGGSGGGLIALDGRTAQSAGGTGGSSLAGGQGGAANGSGSSGEAGVWGIGGGGGGSSLLGGGGGGGGYFGGGGGGSDTDPCCSGAGGGGGGSSYADASVVSNPVLTQGVRIGSGQLVIRYQLAPMVLGVSFETHGDQAIFQIDFTAEVFGFALSDLEFNTGALACDTPVLAGSGASYQLTLSGCEDGELAIAIKPNSVSNTKTTGPGEQFQSSSVLIDTLNPVASWGEVSLFGSVLEFSEPIQTLDLSAIEIFADSATCGLLGLHRVGAATWQVFLSGCENSNLTLSLRELSVSDLSGNPGPVAPVQTSFVAQVFLQPVPEDPEEPVLERIEEPNEDLTEETESGQLEAPAEENAGRPSDNSGTESDAAVIEEPSQLAISQPDKPDQPPRKQPNPEQEEVITQEPNPAVEEPVSYPEAAGQDSFASPPATSLPQASQTVTIPEQGATNGSGQNILGFGLLMMGLFALVAGSVVARRGIPGALTS